MKQILNKIFSVSVVGLLLWGCEEKYEPATVTFYPALEAISAEPEESLAGTAYPVRLKTSRVMIEDSQINIRIIGNGAGYGFSYTTDPPQLEPGIVTITVPYGAADASFIFTPKNDGLFVPTNYQYTFTIEETSNVINSIGQKVFKMTVTDNTAPFFSESFDVCPDVNFVEHVVTGVSTWGCQGFGYPDELSTNRCREANAFGKGGSTGCNTYLVLSDAIDGSQYNSLFINAQVYSRFTGNGLIEFVYSTNYSGTGNPEATGVTWVSLQNINTNLPAPGSQVWKEVGELISNLPDAPIYVAIRHVGGNTTSSSSWRIDNFNLKGN